MCSTIHPLTTASAVVSHFPPYHHHNREQLHSETNSVCRGSGGGSSSLASRCSRHGLATSSTSAVSVAKRRLQRTFDLNKQCREAYVQYRVSLPSIDEEVDDDDDDDHHHFQSCLLNNNRYSYCSLSDGNNSVKSYSDEDDDIDDCTKYAASAVGYVNSNNTAPYLPIPKRSFECRRYKKPTILTFNVTLKGVQDFMSTKEEAAGGGGAVVGRR